ncbi:MAG: phosphohistidine phosphatase SixA [Chloroflexi bacterium]|nr:phosphohistidine phosphatase SixA [Chloroflexota bacterium]
MNLYLMRHAIAAEPDGITADSQRALTEKGRSKLRLIASALGKLDLHFDLILTSPYLRARQTADLVANTLKVQSDCVFVSENLTPLDLGAQLVDEINTHEQVENLLVVGHEPTLSQLIGILVAGDASLGIQMKKGGLCKLLTGKLTYGRCATLEWLLTPAQLMAMQD